MKGYELLLVHNTHEAISQGAVAQVAERHGLT